MTSAKTVENFGFENFFEHILKSMPEHVYWLDTNMVFIGCNEQQAKSIGLSSPEEIIGKTVYDFQSKPDAEHIINNNKKVIESRQPEVFAEFSLLADGTKALYWSHKAPLFDKQGNVIGILGISVKAHNTAHNIK